MRIIRSIRASERQDLVGDLLAVTRLLDVGDLTPSPIGNPGACNLVVGDLVLDRKMVV